MIGSMFVAALIIFLVVGGVWLVLYFATLFLPDDKAAALLSKIHPGPLPTRRRRRSKFRLPK
jgi:hypothetical protein